MNTAISFDFPDEEQEAESEEEAAGEEEAEQARRTHRR